MNRGRFIQEVPPRPIEMSQNGGVNARFVPPMTMINTQYVPQGVPSQSNMRGVESHYYQERVGAVVDK